MHCARLGQKPQKMGRLTLFHPSSIVGYSTRFGRMNLPNALTISRIFLVPLLLTVLLTKNVPHKDAIAVAIVLIAAATDWFDGYLARRMQQVSTLGMLLDPIADKLLVSSVLISMVETQQVAAWMVVIIVSREIAVTGLRSIAQASGYTIAASDL